MRWILMVLLGFYASGTTASEMWRWVDERGVVHFSDRPHPGAERVDVQPAQTFTAPVTPPPAGAEPAAPAAPADNRRPAAGYSRLSIVAPTAGETLWNIGGELNVQLALEPQLASGHELQLYLNGERVEGIPQGVAQFTIGNVFRGENTLRASIVDAQGRELVSSGAVVFYVQQTSIQNPATGPRPQPRPVGR